MSVLLGLLAHASGFIFIAAACVSCVMLYCRCRKLAIELERSLQGRDETITQLKNELKLKGREIQHLSQHITELKDLLQSTVKTPKPLEHRVGKPPPRAHPTSLTVSGLCVARQMSM